MTCTNKSCRKSSLRDTEFRKSICPNFWRFYLLLRDYFPNTIVSPNLKNLIFVILETYRDWGRVYTKSFLNRNDPMKTQTSFDDLLKQCNVFASSAFFNQRLRPWKNTTNLASRLESNDFDAADLAQWSRLGANGANNYKKLLLIEKMRSREKERLKLNLVPKVCVHFVVPKPSEIITTQ